MLPPTHAHTHTHTYTHTYTHTQVISQGLSFILAGYDTTGTTLALTTFLLAHNPTTQECVCTACSRDCWPAGGWRAVR